MAQIFNVATGEKICSLVDPSIPRSGDLYIRTVCFSPDGKSLATGAEDKMIRIWNIETQSISLILRGHSQDIYSLDWLPDGKEIISGSGDRTVKVWNIASGECHRTLVHESEQVLPNTATKDSGVTSVAVHPQISRCLATVYFLQS